MDINPLLNSTNPYKLDALLIDHEGSAIHTGTENRRNVSTIVRDIDLEVHADRDSNVEKWENLGRIGSGGFGSVYLQREAASGEKRAIKRIPRDKTSEFHFLRELLSMIKVINFEHSIQFHGWYESSIFYYIAMEFAEYGDLGTHLSNCNRRSVKLEPELSKEIIYQLLKGLAALHHIDICHRDLKPQNVLITSIEPIHVKLADFGVSKCFVGSGLRTIVGTQGFIAPEILGFLPLKLSKRSGSYTKAIDIWALGCIVYNIFTLEAPFLNKTHPETGSAGSVTYTFEYSHGADIELLRQYCHGNEDVLTGALQSSGTAEPEIAFTKKFLAIDPELRVSAATALMDQWFLPSPSYIIPGANLERKMAVTLPSVHFERTHEVVQSKKSTLNPFPQLANYETCTILRLAVEAGYEDVLRNLLKKGVNLSNPCDNCGNTPLHLAARNGHKMIIQILVENGASLSASNSTGHTTLHVSALKGHKHVVQFLLEKGAKLDTPDNHGYTPIHHAAWGGHTGVVRFLLDNGADLNSMDHNGHTSLHLAARNGHRELVELFLEENAYLCASSEFGYTPLHLAALNGHKDIVRLLLQKGRWLNNARNMFGDTPLHLAVRSGCKDVVRYFLRSNADSKVRNIYGNTPLHLASWSGSLGIVKILLKRRPGFVLNNEGYSPLLLAAVRGHTDIVGLLLDKGADVDVMDRNRNTSLHLAALHGHHDVAQFLLDRGADVDGLDRDQGELHGHQDSKKFLIREYSNMKAFNWRRGTPLHFAAMKGHESIVRLLVDEGADLNALDWSRGTPLHLAAMNGYESVVKHLVQEDADVDALDWSKDTPLHLAAINGHENVVRYLVGAGADVCALNSNRGTPLDLAAAHGHKDTVKLLIETLDKSAYAPGWNRDPPLHLAAMNGHKEVVQFLLESGGADVNALDRNKHTPLHLAIMNSHKDVVQLLLEKGAIWIFAEP